MGLVELCLAILRSSMAEHPTVNRTVVGSSPTAGANRQTRRAHGPQTECLRPSTFPGPQAAQSRARG